MKTIIAGSRTITSLAIVEQAIRESGFDITEVVCGGAKGVDQLGADWAYLHKNRIKWFPADWDKHGRYAGPLRNRAMADYAEALIAVWDGNSRGTKHMIDCATKKGLKVFVKTVYPFA